MATRILRRGDPILVPVIPAEGLYSTLIYGTMAVYVLLFVLGWVNWQVPLFGPFNVGGGYISLAVLHFLSSWTYVDKDQFAAAYFWGRALKILERGPVFRPLGLVQVEFAPSILGQFQAPGEPEEVFHGDNTAPLPRGMVRPIRVTTRDRIRGENGKLDAQMTLDVSFYIQFQIYDFLQFVSTVGTFKHAKKLMRDTCETLVGEWATTHTVNGLILSLPQFNKIVDNRLRKLTKNWGMQIFEAKMLSPDLSHDLAAELRNIPKTRLQVDQVRERADGEQYRLAKEGRGKASARRSFLTAEADGLEAQKKQLSVTGEAVIAKTVAENALANADSVLMGGGAVAELTGQFDTVRHALERGRQRQSGGQNRGGGR